MNDSYLLLTAMDGYQAQVPLEGTNNLDMRESIAHLQKSGFFREVRVMSRNETLYCVSGLLMDAWGPEPTGR